jgi:hypothetical protein
MATAREGSLRRSCRPTSNVCVYVYCPGTVSGNCPRKFQVSSSAGWYLDGIMRCLSVKIETGKTV